MSISTLSELFLEVAGRDQPECLLWKPDDAYEAISASELARRVRKLHTVLLDLGIGPGDRVGLIADNGPHWPLIDFATLTTGAVLVPVYPTLTPEQAAFILDDCGARMVFVEDSETLAGLFEERDRMPSVERFVSIGAVGEGVPEVETLTDLLTAAAEPEPTDFERRARAVGADDLATLIYTSGTTGRPKGVMLTHGNIVSNVLAALEVIPFDGSFTALVFLPLSHSFERTVDYCYLRKGVAIAYAQSIDTLAENLAEVRPHVFVSVPRVYEKILARVQDGVASSSALKRRLFAWSVSIGKRALPDRLAGEAPRGLLGLQLRLADALVFGKIRARLGGRFEFAISGGAPLPPEVAEFFWGAGVRIFEGYGLSETSPVLTVNRPDSVRLGTVGPAIPVVELRIADDGEILARGPNIMRGYHGLPEETAAAIDDEGWFHTGDIGEFDEAWHLRITGRKKELIVNAYGKNIAPSPIENALKASPYIAHAVVIGDRRKFLSALLVPDFAALATWCGDNGIDVSDWETALDDEKVRNLFGFEVARVNEDLSRFQQVKAWELVPNDFSEAGGELTPTQKVKRRVVHEKYAGLIDGVYDAAERRLAAKGGAP